ncbi:MAG: BatA and WFA domain-containing protein [Vicinamibacterales bacterium]
MGGLSFLSPLYLLGALAIAVPIALHLFRRRTELVVEFPAVHLLSKSPVEHRRRRRLREIILLALRVAALVLLAGSFARPYLAGSAVAADAPVTVVALDTSFSLAAADVFARARTLAAEAVQGAPAGHAVGVLAFDDSARTVVEPTSDRGAAAAAIGALTPGWSGTRYGAAIARAAEMIGPRPGRLVVVTDLQQSGWDTQASVGLPDDIEVSVVSVDTPLRNVAVLSAQRRGTGVEAGVYNYGFDARTVPAVLTVDGREVARSTVTLAARSPSRVVFDVEVPATGAAAVSVVDDDGYPADDARYLVLDPPEPVRVAVVVSDPTTLRGGLYVERALGVAGEGRAFTTTVVDGRALSAWTSAEMAREQAVFVLGTRTLDRQGRANLAAYLSGGGAVLLALGPDVDAGTLDDVLGDDARVGADPQESPGGPATLVVNDTRHPILRVFAQPAAALGDVSFQQYRTIDEAGRRVLARFSGGSPALVEQPRERGRLLLFASDLDNRWNRFPLSPSFVPFVVESARYLTDGGRDAQSWVLPAAPAGLEPTPGVFTMEGASGAGSSPGRRVALNVDTRESNPAPVSAEEFAAAVPRTPRAAAATAEAIAAKAEQQQRLWQVGLLLMFVALAGEGLVGRLAN